MFSIEKVNCIEIDMSYFVLFFTKFSLFRTVNGMGRKREKQEKLKRKFRRKKKEEKMGERKDQREKGADTRTEKEIEGKNHVSHT